MSESLWTGAVPGSNAADANSPRTFGVDFTSAVAGTVSAISYYSDSTTVPPANVHVALFDPSVSTVTPLATGAGTITPPATGFQSYAITPTLINGGHIYTACAWIDLAAGAVQPIYGFTNGALTTDHVVGDLTALANTGRFLNNTPSLTYPTSLSTINFFVDITFTPNANTDGGPTVHIFRQVKGGPNVWRNAWGV